jgi:hypothetical protein
MAMKYKINKATYDALPDEMKNEYVAGENDGDFVLDVTGLPAGEDVGPVKRALESERNKSKDLKAQLDGAKATIADFPNVDDLKAQHEKEVGKFKSFTEKTLVDGKAFELASKISTMPKLLAKEIRDRIIVDLTGDEPIAKIKGADGKVSDMTFDKLGEEFVANKDFAGIMIGSKASGGGAPKPGTKVNGAGSPVSGQDGDKPVNLATMSGKDMAARISERKEAEAAAAA